MTNLDEITILAEVNTMVNSITDGAIQHVSAGWEAVNDKTDKPLGTIHNETSKRLYVASQKFKARAKELQAKAVGADTKEEELEFSAASDRAESLAAICRALFWGQVGEDITCHGDSLCLRAGWMIVRQEKPDNSLQNMLSSIFRGGGS